MKRAVLFAASSAVVLWAACTEETKQQNGRGDHGANHEAKSPSGPGELKRTLEQGHGAFYEHACWRCHSLGDEEPPGNPDLENAGPDLSAVGSRLGLEELHQSIVDPSAVIAEPAGEHTFENGKSRMPAFGAAIPAEDLESIVVFLSENKAAEIAAGTSLITVTDRNFEGEVTRAGEALVLLDFWAEWCIPCLELNPVLEEIAPEFRDRVKICKVEADGNPGLVSEFVPDNIFPCLVLMKKGEVVDQRNGTDPRMEPKAFLRMWLSENLTLPE